jgi:dTMP kinase
MAGRFVTFEGGEGAGKTTQIRRLAARLTEAGRTVVVTREPGGTPVAEGIRKVLLGGLAKSLGSEAEALLFAAARADHVDRLIRPALARGDWVLSDRFNDSTYAYQGGEGGVDEELLVALDRLAIGRTRPNLTFILDLPPSVGLARVRDRLSASGGEPDRFEGDTIALHERRRAAYLEIARREPQRCVVVDAGRSESDVAEDIWRAVATRLLDKAI